MSAPRQPPVARCAPRDDDTVNTPEVTDREHTELEAVVKHLSGQMFARGTWDDDPPQLWAILRDGPRSALGSRQLTPSLVPIPRHIWTGRRPDEAVRLTAYAVFEANLTPRDVRAVALGTESWTIQAPEDATDAEREEVVKFAENRRVGDHPWAIEAKNVVAVGVDGWCYSSVRLRGTGREIGFSTPPDGTAVGRIPDALVLALAALRGENPN